MGSYPALAVQPPADPTQGLERAVSLRNLLTNAPYQTQILQQQAQAGALENQQRQQQLKDQQVTSRALLNWNGKDPQDLISDVVKNGGSANAAMGLQQHFLTLRDTASQIALRDSQTGSNNLKTVLDKHDQYLGAINSAENVPDEQLHDHLAQTIDSLIPDNADPQSLALKQGVMRLLQSNLPPSELRKQLDINKAMLQGSKAQFEQAQTQAKTQESQANTQKAQQESAFYQRNPSLGAPGVPAESVSMADFMRKNPGASPSDYQAYKSAQTARAEAPYRVQASIAEGQARGGVEVNTKRQEASDTQYQQAIGADQRLNRMETSYKDATQNNNQQAMLALLTDHIGMTLGLQKGARITKDIINEAQQSQPWLAGLAAKYDRDGYLTGVTLSKTQMQQMMSMGYSQRENAWDAARQTSSMYGVQPPPNANAVYNRRDPNSRVYSGHSFTLNGQRFENVPDALYKKYKGQPGFSE